MTALSDIFKTVFEGKEPVLEFNPSLEAEVIEESYLSTPPIFVVTLAEEPWKKASCLKHFHDLGLSPIFVEGTQGVTLGLRATNPYDYDAHGNGLFMHISQIGCALSHRIALTVALAHGAPEFIICEDDVKLPKNFADLFWAFRNALPEDAQIAQLGYRGAEDKPTEIVNDRVKRVHYPFCASCIWWKRDVVRQALALMRPVDRPYDVILIHRVFPFFNHYVPFHTITDDRSNLKEWPSAVGDLPKIER